MPVEFRKEGAAMLTQTTLQKISSRQDPARDAQAAGRLAANPLKDSIELMGAPMQFSRNEEIYGESEPDTR